MGAERTTVAAAAWVSLAVLTVDPQGAAVAVLTGALSFANLDGASSTWQVDVRQAGPILVDSPLVWHAVTPKAALSWSNSTVVGPGNALYSLSTPSKSRTILRNSCPGEST